MQGRQEGEDQSALMLREERRPNVQTRKDREKEMGIQT
jgi:hypothetical protein